MSQIQLKDYPCLYYLSSRIPVDDQCLFLCGLSSIFELSPSYVLSSSVLFAHTSNGVLYDGKGFTEDNINVAYETISTKSFSNCKNLIRWNIVKKTNMKQDCCSFCPNSSTYRNARIDDERLCLCYTIMTGQCLNIGPQCFYSVLPLAPGNDLSVFPLIPLYQHIQEYFQIQNTNSPYKKETLINDMYGYLQEKYNYTDTKYIDALKQFLLREISFLYNCDLSTISETAANICTVKLLANYFYEAPVFVHPAKPIKVEKSQRKKDNPYLTVPVSSSLEKDTKIAGDNSEKEQYSISDLFNIDDLNKDNAVEDMKKEIYTYDNLSLAERNDISEHSEQTDSNMNNELSYDNTSIENNLNNVYDNDNICYDNVNIISQRDETNVKIHFSLSNIHKIENQAFIDNIINCATTKPTDVLLFLTDTCKSKYISVEAVMLAERKGLLLYTSQSKRFYYFDLEYSIHGYLYPLLSDAKRVEFLSMNPVPAISMFHKLGFESIRINGLSTLYYLSENAVPDLKNEFKMNTCGDPFDILYYMMPLYTEKYEYLKGKMENDSVRETYDNLIKMNTVLGLNYDQTDILMNHERSYIGYSSYEYSFRQIDDLQFKKRGIMYTIEIPKLNMNDSKTFFEDVCIKLYYSLFQCIRNVYLLNISSNSITFYSVQDGDIFFDILINIIRKKYLSLYNMNVELITNRIEYK